MPDRTLAPPRGTRPRNRRALILGAASDLFTRRGYDQIGMTDLAEAVAIGPSALYRHFSGKQDLLREVIAGGMAPIRHLLDDLDLADRSTASARLAALCLDECHIGVLWQREARHLTPDDHALLRAEVREIGRRLTDRVRAARPEFDTHTADLVTWATLAVLMSPSFHHLDLSRPAYDELLAELADLVLDTPLPSTFAAPPPLPAGPALLPASRREALFTQAVRMFATQGYAGVGIEDIGNAVGITGPSVYNHFPSKLDMLRTAFQRGTAALLMDVSAVYQTSNGAADALRRLIGSYIRFTQAHHDLIGLLITEVEHLPEDERHAARRAQHDYLTEWVHLLRLVHPELDPTAARIRVHAAVAVANDTARTPHLRHNPDVPAAVESICSRLLGL
ncbi:TetR/AcrR family transcriptional regulator [Candidatus Protofrankia californiensis]|uniref:TetR/AcrR family transcriptional regulator n=1 Tax=Candidatus Protofrankia californiensis TaxID=1839754 RepID=UPI0013E9F89F|nr:TetR/AcrR family transcriptional regulator [Candidatus Protofrankia californiensis]